MRKKLHYHLSGKIICRIIARKQLLWYSSKRRKRYFVLRTILETRKFAKKTMPVIGGGRMSKNGKNNGISKILAIILGTIVLFIIIRALIICIF